MRSLFRLQSAAHRRLNLHRPLSLSTAQNQHTETLEPIDPRKLPTDYDPSSFDPSNHHREPPTPRVWRLVDEVSSLTLAELADLSQILIQKIGIKEPPVVAIMGAGAGSAAAGKGGAGEKAGKEDEKKEEKTVFELKLEGFEAANKIKVIKEVRGFTDLGLKEAKDLVEKAPVVIKGGVSKEDGLAILEKMKAVGAKVVLE